MIVKHIWTIFCKHNPDHFHFLIQTLAFAKRVNWISQRLELWVANSPCPPRCRVESGFLPFLPFPSSQILLVEKENQCLVQRRHLLPAVDFPRSIQRHPCLTAQSHWYPYPVLQPYRELSTSFHAFFAAWEWFGFELNGCLKSFAWRQ